MNKFRNSVSALACMSVLSSTFLTTPSYAQPTQQAEASTAAENKSNKNVAKTQNKVERCPIPYTVGEKLAGGEIAARFSDGALGKLSKSDVALTTGYEVEKSAYAGIVGQAMSSVFKAYACRIYDYIDVHPSAESEAQKDAVRDALTNLDLEMGTIQNAAQNGGEAIKELKNEYRNAKKRDDSYPTLDAGITSAALADVDPNKAFISSETHKGWVQLNFATAEIGACGGVVRAAISDGGSSLQKSLADAKSILINYLDPKTPPSVALSQLFINLSSSPIKKDTSQLATWQGCLASHTPKASGSQKAGEKGQASLNSAGNGSPAEGTEKADTAAAQPDTGPKQ